jgi:cell division septum initiation protein DivIVA
MTETAIERLRKINLRDSHFIDIKVRRRGAWYSYEADFLKDLQREYTVLETDNAHLKARIGELENKIAGTVTE